MLGGLAAVSVVNLGLVAAVYFYWKSEGLFGDGCVEKTVTNFGT